jgi:hypothetical protein
VGIRTKKLREHPEGPWYLFANQNTQEIFNTSASSRYALPSVQNSRFCRSKLENLLAITFIETNAVVLYEHLVARAGDASINLDDR